MDGSRNRAFWRGVGKRGAGWVGRIKERGGIARRNSQRGAGRDTERKEGRKGRIQ